MSNKTDNKLPRTDIYEYLPDVYRSDINEAIFEDSFNRHLTKDNTVRISGYIGQGNPNALIKRQIKEPDTFRQAYQLQPTAYTEIGDEQAALAFKSFQKQLELMGVDPNRMDVWGSSEKFNWVPPINIDMFINYQDYYWYDPTNPTSSPQYLTIENRCNKAGAKVSAYQKLLDLYGETFPVIEVDAINDTFTISGLYQSLFSAGFVFFTDNTTNVNVRNKFWTTVSSLSTTEVTSQSGCNVTIGKTVITVLEDIAIKSATPPTTTSIGRWWLDTTTNTLYAWDGSSWVLTSSSATVDISLSQLLNTFLKEQNCICSGDYGWDLALWDDNQSPGSTVLWIYDPIITAAHPGGIAFITAISQPSLSAWIVEFGAPSQLDLWYDTTDDILKQWNGSSWIDVVGNFSLVLDQITGTVLWDKAAGCDVQQLNQWSQQNKWIHKSQVGSFAGVQRAQLPILEYGSTVELSRWTKYSYGWKYRADANTPFTAISTPPTRFELEPVKGYVAVEVNPADMVTPQPGSNVWIMYLFDKNKTINANIDYSQTFVPGFKFRLRNDGLVNQIYTVKSVEHRQTNSAIDPVRVCDANNQYMVTIIQLEESTFSAPTFNYGYPSVDDSDNYRLEPTQTSVGDPWAGYQAQWLMDLEALQASPNKPVSSNIFFVQGINDPLLTTTSVTPQGILSVSPCQQELTLTIASQTTIMLDSSLVYNPAISQQFSIAASEDICVFVNDVRQYGNYNELTSTSQVNYTAIGNGINNTPSQPSQTSVIGVQFHQPLNIFDVVRIEIGPASQLGMGYISVPVRTVEDEAAFIAGVISGDQPEYRSLTTYKKTEQSKIAINQYPSFDVYDVCTGEVVAANPTFAYVESSDAPINPNIQKRVVANLTSREFTFEQYLLKQSNGPIYGYHDQALSDPNRFWFSPLLNKLFYRMDGAWSEQVNIEITSQPPSSVLFAVKVIVPVISNVEPIDQLNNDGALWFNTRQQQLFQRNVSMSAWVEVLDVVINDIDPLLRTIWRHGNQNSVYVPEYVNVDREPVPIGDPDGTWALPDQWYYNPSHYNQAQVTYAQLLAHFQTIIAAQPATVGFSGGGAFSLTQNQYNYSLGGTIREYNNSYDTLISAVNVENTTPVSLIDWAEDQYATGLLAIKTGFDVNVVRLMTTPSPETIAFFSDTVSDIVLERLRFNEFLSVVYQDTSAYNSADNIGVPNWISTVPMFGLGIKTLPYLNVDPQLKLVELVHHDGHRSQIVYSAAEYDQYATQIIETPDPRVPNQTFGKLSPLAPPTTVSAFTSQFGGTEIRPGCFWYQLNIGIRKLFKLNTFVVQPTAPPFVLNGKELNDGTYYYNTTNNTLYVKQGLSWNVVTVVGDGVITDAWEEVSFSELLGQVELNIETQLYDVTPDYKTLVFDYGVLTATPADQLQYDALQTKQFYEFLIERNILNPFFNSTYTPTDAFTWNYVLCSLLTTPTGFVSPNSAASWQMMYQRWFGTAYPHLEPWKLQGYVSKPVWWDTEYLNTDPSMYSGRRWKFTYAPTITSWGTGMWENVRLGLIPAGRPYPNGVIATTGNPGLDGQPALPTYLYVPVNISSTTIAGGYLPDNLLPPYYDISLAPQYVRSFFTNFTTQIVAPDADFKYGDGSYYEWLWSVSSEYVYDQLIIAFEMQPVRFMHSAFGVQFANVDALQIDTTFCQVYSHEDALFHGDIYDENITYLARGLNQWYVNFNRFSGFDTNQTFREQWAGWVPKLTYQFAGIVDTSTFQITNKYFDVINQDYNIILSNIGVIRDLWSDAFKVSILNIPPAIIQYNNQSQWKFEINALAPVSRNIQYYDVKVYPFTSDVNTSTFTAYQYSIVSADSATNRFFVNGNQTNVFEPGANFTVSGSAGNDGVYNVSLSLYEPAINQTRINVIESVASSTPSGTITLNNVSLPWNTGDAVVVSSTKILPVPLLTNTYYYVIRLSPTTFQLAETNQLALDNIPITLTQPGTGEFTVGEIKSTFITFGGASPSQDVWIHYELDRERIRTLQTPTGITGIQSLINVIDGFSAHQTDVNLQQYGVTSIGEFDYQTGRQMNWQTEIERFIDWAFRIRRSRLVVADRFGFEVYNLANDELRFTQEIPAWVAGQPIVVSTTGALPSPLTVNTTYFFAPTITPGVFKLSYTQNVNIPTAIVDITTMGSGIQYVAQYTAQQEYPTFEMNPSRNNIVIDTPQGIISNIVDGPYPDIELRQTIFDQYGRPLNANQFQAYRLDEQTKLSILPQLPNDVSPQPTNLALADPYNFLHFGGAHLFIEGYEHYLIFNDYTVSGSLIYDPFLGLNAPKFDVDYYETDVYTLRPTIGGYYLLNGKFYRNIEGSTVDMENYYDTYAKGENSEVIRRARALLGYDGPTYYLDALGANLKTQFLFYQGMIQAKGSTNSIKAYINSRKFASAKVDEYWAYKVADFGDSRPKVYPEIKLRTSDTFVNDVRLMFLANTETATDPDVEQAVDEGFELISFKTPERWVDYPDQKLELKNNPLFLDAKVSKMIKIYAGSIPPAAGQEHLTEYWFDTINDVLNQWDGTSWVAVVDTFLTVNGLDVYIDIVALSDDVRVIRQNLDTPGDLRTYTNEILIPGDGINEYQRINARVLKFNKSGFTNIINIFAINVANTKLNPGQLIDSRAKVVVSEVPLWDPARGQQYWVAAHNIDLQSSVDPGQYNTTLNPNDISPAPWNYVESGTMWLDTSTLSYLPYYDDKITPNVNDRLFNWGKLSEWGEVNVYQWVESTVPPSEWDQVAALQSSDTTIPQELKTTGTAKRTLWKRTRTNRNVVGIDFVNDRMLLSQPLLINNPLPDATEVLFSTLNDQVLPDVLEVGVPYYTTTYSSNVATSEISVSDEPSGLIVDLLPTFDVAPASSNAVVNVDTGVSMITVDGPYGFLYNQPVRLSAAGNGTLPAPLRSDITYYVLGDTPVPLAEGIYYQQFALGTVPSSPTPIVFSDSGSLPLTVSAFEPAQEVNNINFTANNAVVVGGSGFMLNQPVKLVPKPGKTLPTGFDSAKTYYAYPYPTTPPVLNSPGDRYTTVYFYDEPWFIAGANQMTISLDINVVPSFVASDWTTQEVIHQTYLPPIAKYTTPPTMTSNANPVFSLSSTDGWAEGDIVNVYVNGILKLENKIVIAQPLTGDLFVDGTGVFLSDVDVVDVVRPLYAPTETELAFDPDVEDDGTTAVQWRSDYQYSVYTVNANGESQVRYYFWVQDIINRRERTAPGSISSFAVQRSLETIPTPYLVMMLPKDDPYLIQRFGWGISPYGKEFSLSQLPDNYAFIPVYYRQAILRQARDYITDGDRFVLRFTRDLTLRDNLDDAPRPVNLKNKHQEWLLIRQFQETKILEKLWKKMIECIVGYDLNDPSIRVPTLERELFDAANGTQTRYGLGEGQAFANGTLALNSILSYLRDPNVDFYPIDINSFFESNDFTTPQGIIDALTEIYTTFNTDQINTIWFNVLQDAALPVQPKYKQIFKTSWVSIYGVRIIDVGGAFDD